MGELSHALRTDGRTFALRFVVALVGLGLAWVLIAPVYAAVLARVTSPVVRVLVDPDPTVRVETEGAKIIVQRPLPPATDGQRRTARQGIWSAALTWNSVILAAALLAFPGWSPGRRRRSLVVGLAALACAHIGNIFVNAAYTRERFASLGAAPLAGESPLGTVSYFFDTMGAGLLALLLFVWLVTREDRPQSRQDRRRARAASRSPSRATARG